MFFDKSLCENIKFVVSNNTNCSFVIAVLVMVVF